MLAPALGLTEVAGLLESYAFNKNSFLKLGFDSNLPQSSLRATVKSVARWTWELPEQTVLQSVQIIATDHQAVDMYTADKDTSNPLLAELIQKQAQVFEKMKTPGWSDTTPFLNQRHVLLTLSTPCKVNDPSELDIEQALRHQAAFQATLEQSFRFEVLSAAKIQAYQRLQLNPFSEIKECPGHIP